jgi:hypothetical protein
LKVFPHLKFNVKTQVNNYSLYLLLFKIILSVLHMSTPHTHTKKKNITERFLYKIFSFSPIQNRTCNICWSHTHIVPCQCNYSLSIMLYIFIEKFWHVLWYIGHFQKLFCTFTIHWTSLKCSYFNKLLERCRTGI